MGKFRKGYLDSMRSNGAVVDTVKVDKMTSDNEMTYDKFSALPTRIEDVCNGQPAMDTTNEEVVASQTEDRLELEYSRGMSQQQVL